MCLKGQMIFQCEHYRQMKYMLSYFVLYCFQQYVILAASMSSSDLTQPDYDTTKLHT